ncbi:coiled-coil domain-containing protein 170 [Cyclopterus lumpus]|uniref:coiled-coil domain-containing protein 170 n=1 Tax=Cyclopterus lumpus TaxID=8103 RepID=UPI0014868CAB|nr:coiled-coil domain-containing protein 170 [Cyclopterus lumpus]
MENSDEVDQSHERERLKMRIAVLDESVNSCEVECKASRETVVMLVAELDRERRKAASSVAALDSLKGELDGLVVGRRSVEMERGTLVERLDASKRVVEAARRESRCLEKQVEELERKLQWSHAETRAAEEKLQVFLEKVSALLQGKSEKAPLLTEEEVLHDLENVCNKSLSEMEARLCRVSEELSEHADLRHRALQRAQLAEQQVQDLRERLRGLETELMAADMQRDGLRLNKQHYEEFLEQLSETMRVDGIAVDLGFDMRLKLILSRTEQLVRQEAAALVESKSLTYSLQRKFKSQKDQLESKGLHVQLLRNKVSQLEEEKRSRSASAVGRDDAHLETRRLQKKVERLQGELKATKLSNTELKAQLSHTSELKLKVVEQSPATQEQSKRPAQLAEAEKKLDAVSAELQSREQKTREDQQQLNALRRSLTQLSDRERELLDFRTVVSQMLGLDATALALPSYEIIKSLEGLLHPHHHHHHHHRHGNVPRLCTHQRPLPASSSFDVSPSGSAPLHEAQI